MDAAHSELTARILLAKFLSRHGCRNMPLRCLEYVTAQYSKMFKKKKKYEKKPIKLPKPEFYVFYNGKENFPKETEMKLSDSFMETQQNNDETSLDLKVKVYNINEKENLPILQKN